ncbi:MAG: hypothetical protein R6U98_33455, partial [Pirellulaceae bacterium]
GLVPWSVTFHATDGQAWCVWPVCSGEREPPRDKPVASMRGRGIHAGPWHPCGAVASMRALRVQVM